MRAPVTETEWLTGRYPWHALENLKNKPGKRKRRLFACACCYRLMDLYPTTEARAAVVAAGQFTNLDRVLSVSHPG